MGTRVELPLPGAGEAVSETALDSRKFAAGAAAMLLRGLLSKEEWAVVPRIEERAVHTWPDKPEAASVDFRSSGPFTKA